MHSSFNLFCSYCFTKTVILSETLAFGYLQPYKSPPTMSGNGIPQYRYICLPGLGIIDRVIQMQSWRIPQVLQKFLITAFRRLFLPLLFGSSLTTCKDYKSKKQYVYK